MKKIILVLSLIAAYPSISEAQTKKAPVKTEIIDPAQYAERLSKSMQHAVNLNDQQYREVFDVNMQYATQLNELRSMDKPEPGKLAEIKKIREEKLHQMLTPEQQQQFQAWRKTRKDAADDAYDAKMADKAKTNATDKVNSKIAPVKAAPKK